MVSYGNNAQLMKLCYSHIKHKSFFSISVTFMLSCTQFKIETLSQLAHSVYELNTSEKTKEENKDIHNSHCTVLKAVNMQAILYFSTVQLRPTP